MGPLVRTSTLFSGSPSGLRTGFGSVRCRRSAQQRPAGPGARLRGGVIPARDTSGSTPWTCPAPRVDTSGGDRGHVHRGAVDTSSASMHMACGHCADMSNTAPWTCPAPGVRLMSTMDVNVMTDLGHPPEPRQELSQRHSGTLIPRHAHRHSSLTSNCVTNSDLRLDMSSHQ